MPRVSVVIPLYNKASYIARALESISRQTFADFEIIVVDDGSTDDSLAIARKHRDERMIVLQQPNEGPGAARNAGIARSTSPILAFLDADDEWLPTYLEQGVETIANLSPEIPTHTCTYFDEPGNRDSTPLWRRRGFVSGTYRLSPKISADMFLHLVAFLSPCTTLVRADTARRFGGFYTRDGCRYAEDAHLWLRILLQCPVSISLQPQVRLHRNASHLSAALRVPRPLEPFLAHPDEIRLACPGELRPLLESFFAIRAFKTACAWSYWGRVAAARSLMEQFHVPNARSLPFYWLAHSVATPWGGAAGVLIRRTRTLLEGFLPKV